MSSKNFINSPAGKSIMIGLFYLIAFIAITIASYTDIRTREVPDLLNYGLVFIAIAARTLFALANNDTSIFVEGFLGGLLAFAIGALMYYTGQWGGGDTKLLAGLGILIGLPWKFEMGFLSIFLVSIFFAGAAYALVLSIIAAIRNRKNFGKEAAIISGKLKRMKIALIMFIFIVVVSMFFVNDVQVKILLFSLAIISVMTLYVYIFIKSVEKVAMLKMYSVSKLTEGDWIAKEVYVGKKLICGPKDLGISAEKILLLKKHKIKSVLVKEGIPFVPSFFIAFLLTYFLGNWFMLFFKI